MDRPTDIAARSRALPPRRVVLRNADILVLAVTVLAFALAQGLGPTGSCGSGEVGEPSTLFNVVAVIGGLGFVVAGILAVFCRRRVVTKVAGLLVYGAITVPAVIDLTFVGSPCALY